MGLKRRLFVYKNSLIPLFIFSLGLLAGCATDFSPNYALDFVGYPAPVLLNAQSEEILQDESRHLTESVTRSAVSTSVTMVGSADSSGNWSGASSTTTSTTTSIDESTPIGVKLFIRTQEKDIPLALADIKLWDYSLFLFGAAAFITDFSVSAYMGGGMQ